ncbi:MAG: Smr/MutS family protein [Flavobacteriales bacterium]|nr:Smr/MutS family protein [Flavobacteriales bacterium]MCX7768448.1 Smr/MutS family protein [Flavobacteriales bacterium]MDW8410853.1 Smr/MutS family protein [Flavobacteriales bacterium]
MKSLKPGCRVAFKDREGEGTLLAVHQGMARILLNEGLEITVSVQELVAIPPNREEPLKAPFSSLGLEKRDQDVREYFSSTAQSSPALVEIDLHYPLLSGQDRFLDATGILCRQLSFLQDQLERLRARGYRKAIVIHGQGSGLLRSEVMALLRRQPDIQFQPADPERYGNGALEVTFID